jgi:hypothetical protein
MRAQFASIRYYSRSLNPAPAMITDNPALPSYTRPEALAVAPDLQLMADLLAGSRRMWQQSAIGTGGVPYIFKWDKENPKTYDIRRRCETVFEGTGRTLSASVGMLFAKPPKVTWNQSETAMTEIWANLDGAGTAGPVLVKRFTEAALRDGLGAILVDHPKPPAPQTTPLGVVTSDIAKKLGLQPRWALYARKQIINWRTAVVNNQNTLTMIVFAESADVNDGEFGTKTVQRFRVIRLVLAPEGNQATWRLYELKDETGDKIESFQIVGEGSFTNKAGAIADFLPVSIAYAGRTDAPMTATIPLLGVAFANLSHWQQSTDLRFYRMVAAYPQPLVKGQLMPDAKGVQQTLGLGPLVAVNVKADGDYLWREIEGKSMVQLESGITEKLQQMAALGLAFLHSETRHAETAAAKRIDSVAQNSTLATAGQGDEDGVNMALEHTAWYLGIEKAGAPVLTINRDFELATLDAQTLTAYVALVGAGYPKRLVLQVMQVAGMIGPDEKLEDVEIEWEDGLMAAQLAKEQAAKDALAVAQAKAKTNPTPAIGDGKTTPIPAAA